MPNPFTDGYWIYNQTNGEIKHVSLGVWTFKYSIVAGVWIPFKSKAQAEAYAKEHPVKKGVVPTIVGGIVDPDTGISGAKNAVTNVANDVLKPLFQPNLWIRVGEVALGIILIAVGVARITNVVPVATKIAKAVA